MIAALSLALLAGSALASPIHLNVNVARELKPINTEVTIHESCNATQRRMLKAALDDTWEIVTFAQEYVATNGAEDEIFKTYFGDKPEAYATVLGVFEAVLTSNKDGVLLRCDDIDGNCHQDGWRGHWRGENGTSETVICDASYTDRVYNEAFCMYGYQLTQKAPSYYWGVDLIHRLFHVPKVTNGLVEHYANNYAEVIELAEHNSTYSPVDSDALQWFAAHVYAVEVAQGGDTCIGDTTHTHDHSSSASAPTSTAASAAAAQNTATATSSAAAECHTHSDGVVHCS